MSPILEPYITDKRAPYHRLKGPILPIRALYQGVPLGGLSLDSRALCVRFRAISLEGCLVRAVGHQFLGDHADLFGVLEVLRVHRAGVREVHLVAEAVACQLHERVSSVGSKVLGLGSVLGCRV